MQIADLNKPSCKLEEINNHIDGDISRCNFTINLTIKTLCQEVSSLKAEVEALKSNKQCDHEWGFWPEHFYPETTYRIRCTKCQAKIIMNEVKNVN